MAKGDGFYEAMQTLLRILVASAGCTGHTRHWAISNAAKVLKDALSKRGDKKQLLIAVIRHCLEMLESEPEHG